MSLVLAAVWVEESLWMPGWAARKGPASQEVGETLKGVAISINHYSNKTFVSIEPFPRV